MNIQFPDDKECSMTVPNACIRMSTLLTLLAEDEEEAPRGTPDTTTHTSHAASYRYDMAHTHKPYHTGNVAVKIRSDSIDGGRESTT